MRTVSDARALSTAPRWTGSWREPARLGVEHRPPAPLLLGRHLLALGLTPGPRVGEVLKQVYEKQLDGEITSVEEGVEEAKRILAEMSEPTEIDTKVSGDAVSRACEALMLHAGPEGPAHCGQPRPAMEGALFEPVAVLARVAIGPAALQIVTHDETRLELSRLVTQSRHGVGNRVCSNSVSINGEEMVEEGEEAILPPSGSWALAGASARRSPARSSFGCIPGNARVHGEGRTAHAGP